MSNFHNHEWATLEAKRARDKSKGRKIQNNTYLRELPDGSFAVKLHAVDVVIIHPDGTYTLNNGGWNTITTLDRIRRYSPSNWNLYSERGDWYVKMEPTDRDPRPEGIERSIPRPFEATDPGPEPVKVKTADCKAGQIVTTEHVDEVVECWRRDVKDGEEIIEVVSDGFEPGGEYDRVKVARTWNSHVYYSEGQYWDEEWAKLPGNRSGHGNSFNNAVGEEVKRIQCPHCAEFDAIHERWKRAYEGGTRYGRQSIDQQKGHRTYAHMMKRFGGDVDAWQEAYMEDFRARRAYLKADREWVQRNRVPFYDGIRVDSEGYTPRVRQEGPSPAKLRRHEASVAKMKKRIDKFVTGYIDALKKGMPMPSGGDCWYCSMTAHDGKPLGDAVDTLYPDGRVRVQANHEHLDSHMKERYYVPSLAVNALRERGYLDVGIYMLLDMDPIRPGREDHGEPSKMVGTGKMGGRQTGKKAYDGVRRDLRKYMVKRLIPAAPTS